MSDSVREGEVTLKERILHLVEAKKLEGEYVTVRFAAKTLEVGQTDIKNNLPDNTRLIPSQNGTLSESKIEIVPEGEVSIAGGDVPAPVSKPKKAKEKKMSDQVLESQEVQVDEDGNPIASAPHGTGGSIDQNTGESVPEAELAVCIVCGNKVRRTTITRRGVCPLCFAQLARNSKLTSKALMEMTDEEFDAIVGNELGNRRSLEEYKASRILSPEEFEERKDGIVPVKVVFAAAKEAGFGPGRVAQAMGGDRFRHEPLGGFGSVWTPFFVGARKAWYFDKAILESFDQLRKPVKEKVVKPKKEKGTKAAGGTKMTPVVEDGSAGIPADQDTAEMASTPS